MTNKEQFLAKLKEKMVNRKPNHELATKYREMLQRVFEKIKQNKK